MPTTNFYLIQTDNGAMIRDVKIHVKYKYTPS